MVVFYKPVFATIFWVEKPLAAPDKKLESDSPYISILGPKFERKTISGAHREGALEVSGVGIFSAH